MTNRRIPTITPGIRYMLIATLGFTIMQGMIKDLSHFHVFQIVFFRSCITAALCISYLWHCKISLIGNNQKFLFLRAVFGIISMTLFFATVQRMPFGASISLKYLSPIFTAIFAVLLLKEDIRFKRWICFLVALIGVFLLKGFDSRIDIIGFVMGILGALFGGLVYVTIRYIGKSENPMVIVNYFMLTAAILSSVAMIPYWRNPNSYEWIILLLIGCFGYIGQVFMTKSFQAEAASRVAPVKYVEVIYSLIIGFVWYDETYTILSLCGMILILVSMVYNVILKETRLN